MLSLFMYPNLNVDQELKHPHPKNNEYLTQRSQRRKERKVFSVFLCVLCVSATSAFITRHLSVSRQHNLPIHRNEYSRA